MDVKCPIGLHHSASGSQKMISAHDELRQQEDDEMLEEHEDLIEGEEEYELTELKNVSKLDDVKGEMDNLVSLDPHSMNHELEELAEDGGELEEDIQHGLSEEIKTNIQLANAVFHYPCLYDTMDPNFHAKQFKGSAWNKVARTLMWSGDLQSLQMEWRQLKDHYLRYLRKESHEPDFQVVWDEMKWLNRFLVPHNDRVIHGHGQQQHSQRGDFYADQGQTVAEDVMISGYPRQSSGRGAAAGSQHSNSTAQTAGQQQQQQHTEMRSSGTGSSGGGGYYILQKGNANQGHIRVLAENQHGSQTTRVTVVPATRTANGTAVVQLPPGSYPRNQRVQIIHTPSSSGYDHRVNVGDPGVTVTERGTVQRTVHVIKKEGNGPMTMVADSNEYYATTGANGEQKVYRVMPMHSEMHAGQASPQKRMRIVRTPNQPQPVGMMAIAPSTSRHSIPMATLGEEVVIEDGVAERIVIEQDVQPESPLLTESPGIGSMISGSNFQSGLGGASPSNHPGYLQQSQYDADLQFQQLISSSLARIEEHEKAIVKFQIQKILLEARYGSGFSKTLCQDEDLESTNGVAPHELVPQ